MKISLLIYAIYENFQENCKKSSTCGHPPYSLGVCFVQFWMYLCSNAFDTTSVFPVTASQKPHKT